MKKILNKYREEYVKLLKLGGPILVTQLSVIVLAFSDTLMVGHYSVGALAASAFVNSMFLIPNVMLMGLAGGVTPLVGALYSQRRYFSAGRITCSSMQVNLIVSLLFTAVMGTLYFFLDHFGQDEALLPQIRDYYLVLLLVPVPMALYNVLMQTSNGIECTTLPMWITMGCIGFNILGNWLLIYGIAGVPELGLLGAGISTVLARVLALLAMWICFRSLNRYRNYQEGFRNGRRLLTARLKVWRTSWPVMLQSGCECALWAVGGVVVGWFGAVQLAAYQVINTISQLGFMVYISFAAAVAIRVAYYAGQHNDRGAGAVARAGLVINLGLATFASAIFLIFGKWLITLFVNTGPEAADGAAVVLSAAALLAPMVMYQYMDATQLTFCNAIRGTSQVRPLFWISLICYMVIGIPFLMWFAVGLDGGNAGAYWSFNVALLAASVMATLIFKKIKL